MQKYVKVILTIFFGEKICRRLFLSNFEGDGFEVILIYDLFFSSQKYASRIRRRDRVLVISIHVLCAA